MVPLPCALLGVVLCFDCLVLADVAAGWWTHLLLRCTMLLCCAVLCSLGLSAVLERRRVEISSKVTETEGKLKELELKNRGAEQAIKAIEEATGQAEERVSAAKERLLRLEAQETAMNNEIESATKQRDQ
jgi:septal ring factor EnvC (AmiA/AmiB activator)